MFDYEPEEQPRLESYQPSASDFFLKGFADGHNGRRRAKLPSSKDQEAYDRGFNQATPAARPKTKRRQGQSKSD